MTNLLVSGRKVSDGTTATDPFGFIESTGSINANSITNPVLDIQMDNSAMFHYIQ